MIIMGIDPGFARVGWALVTEKNAVIKPIAYGCVETEKEMRSESRLLYIFKTLSTLLVTHKPESMAVEDLFFATNAKTVIRVGESRGVVILSAAVRGIPVVSYSPLAVKRSVTGDGKADKKQVERMVMLTLRLKETPKPDDTIDALAIAMTHAYSYRINELRIKHRINE